MNTLEIINTSLFHEIYLVPEELFITERHCRYLISNQ